jgi:two-component system, NarL family, response regulator DevR
MAVATGSRRLKKDGKPDREIRIVIVDDHQLVRDGLRALLGREPGMTVVAEAEDAGEAVRRVVSEEPDVVTLDIDLPDTTGIEACARIKAISPETRVLMLTAYADAEAFRAARGAGADGFVLKRTRDFQLVERIKQVADGQSAFEDAPVETEDPILSRLTQREMSILELIAEGKTNREIAESLFLAEKTVKNYVSNLLSKMGISHRSAAAAYVARLQTARNPLGISTPSGN